MYIHEYGMWNYIYTCMLCLYFYFHTNEFTSNIQIMYFHSYDYVMYRLLMIILLGFQQLHNPSHPFKQRPAFLACLLPHRDGEGNCLVGKPQWGEK